MPKHRKCFTLESYHHGAGEVYRFACSNEYGKVTTRVSYSDSIAKPGKGMKAGITPSNLDQITFFLISLVKEDNIKEFSEVISRNFIYPNGITSSKEWRSSINPKKWGEDTFITCSVQPIVEKIQFSNSHRDKLFASINESKNRNNFTHIYKNQLNKSLTKLQQYQKVRESQAMYTGFRFGFSKTEKIHAAALLKNFYLGKVDTATFYSAANSKSRKALKQGKLGRIYNELKADLPKP